MQAIIDIFMTVAMVGIMLYIITGYYAQKYGKDDQKDNDMIK